MVIKLRWFIIFMLVISIFATSVLAVDLVDTCAELDSAVNDGDDITLI